MLLAGDVGGTKVDLGIFDAERGPRAPLVRARFASAEHPDLSSILGRFLSGAPRPIHRACLAVAGPVVDGRSKVTNLPWILSEAELGCDLGIGPVHLLNDLEAITTGVMALSDTDLQVINQGEPEPGGAVAVIAPGTGLGEGFAVWDGSRYRAHPSEGGHSAFAPADELQSALLEFLRRRHVHVSFERVCSGMAVPGIYQFLRDTGRVTESAAVAGRLATAGDRTPVILQAGIGADPDPLCAATVELFVSVLGAEAGNLALKVLATGGVFLAGGIPPRIRSAFDRERFMRAFATKGRLSPLLEKMPVRLVLTRAALIGAAMVGFGLDATRGEGR